MLDQLSASLDYAHKNRERFTTELIEFVNIPSISTDPIAKEDVQRAARWVATQLAQLGAKNINIFATQGHPIVYGEMLDAGEDKPIALVYGHYDVQPAEPLELWESPPFKAEQRGENLYGRGVSDMKAQVMVALKAVESLVRTGSMPINLKFLFEGEEEIGSPSLEEFLEQHKTLLSCDFSINPDAGMISPDIPTITYGLRGLAYFELRISGPEHDLHSGLYGGAVHNPAQVLCELIAGMHDSQGRVTLPGFYDKVRPLEPQERLELARLPMDEGWYLEQTGAPALYGESGYTPVERVGTRPTLEVNGLFAGFIGEGSKTVLPAKAMAKISTRLVPDQDPDDVYRQLLQYLESHVPNTVKWELIKMVGGIPSISDLSIQGVKALNHALEETWGKRPVFKREGGSVPVVSQMQRILGVESVLTGFGLLNDGAHAPNEKLHLPTYYKGIDAFIRYFILLGQ